MSTPNRPNQKEIEAIRDKKNSRKTSCAKYSELKD